jgi:hypothetical protein
MRPVLVLAVLAMFPLAACAQDTYNLKLPLAAKGDVSRVEFSMRQSFRLLKLDAFGNEFRNDSNDAGAGLIYVDTILDQSDQKTTRFRRHFERAVQTVDTSDPVPMACHDKTILVEVKDGKTQVMWEGGQMVPDSFAQQMEAILKGSKENFAALTKVDPLPKAPVKVGESWTIDIRDLVRECEAKHGCEVTDPSGTAVLEKVEKREGHLMAVMVVKVQVPLKCITQGDKRIALNNGSGMTWESTYEFCVDSSTTAFKTHNRFHFLTSGTAPERNGLSTRLRLETDVELSETRVPGQP